MEVFTVIHNLAPSPFPNWNLASSSYDLNAPMVVQRAWVCGVVNHCDSVQDPDLKCGWEPWRIRMLVLGHETNADDSSGRI
jgi:hypothetical protein